MVVDFSFWNAKRVFLTGHTGFKGSWLCRILLGMGVHLTGYALEPPTHPNLYSICDVDKRMTSIIGDIRDREYLISSVKQAKPEIIIHMAAQPLVRDSYNDPVYTYETNVMGTVNILECIRLNGGVKSFLNVTTDKVYHNNEWEWGYRETDPLDGFDPYSNSKSCAELVTHCYKNSFFPDGNVAISTARAGNVIGGGDFATDRIIPDCIRAAMKKEVIAVRNPHSIRPYEHALEPLFAYLMILQKQYEDEKFAGCYNVGPDDRDCFSTGALVDLFCNTWGENQTWVNQYKGGPHEANYLKLDCSKLKSVFGWEPTWDINKSIDKTVEWTREYMQNGNICAIMDKQISEFIEDRGC